MDIFRAGSYIMTSMTVIHFTNNRMLLIVKLILKFIRFFVDFIFRLLFYEMKQIEINGVCGTICTQIQLYVMLLRSFHVFEFCNFL